jgi:hypothetical protein
MSDGSFTLDQPEQIAMFHVMQLRSALGMEIRTGMKFSNKGSIMKHAKHCGYTDKQTKRGVYADLNKLIVDGGGMDRPLPPDTK